MTDSEAQASCWSNAQAVRPLTDDIKSDIATIVQLNGDH
jgi:hypothetical protein